MSPLDFANLIQTGQGHIRTRRESRRRIERDDEGKEVIVNLLKAINPEFSEQDIVARCRMAISVYTFTVNIPKFSESRKATKSMEYRGIALLYENGDKQNPPDHR